MAHASRQVLPSPPAEYDQSYIAKLAEAINRYMFELGAGELIAPRFIITDPPIVGPAGQSPPADYPDTSTLPTGTLYLAKIPGTETNGTVPRFLTVVMKENL